MAKKKTTNRGHFAGGKEVVAGGNTKAGEEVSAASKLKESDRFFIDNHPEKTDVELAVELELQVKLIEEYRFERTKKTQANRMLHRPTKGVVAMTEASSMATDDRTRHLVTSIEVKKAIDEGDYEKAGKLQKQLKAQQEESEAKQRQLNQNRIHYIN